MRTFETGATRDTDDGKPEYGGYLSPLVIQAFGEYMLRHQTQADGKKREAGNWKKGMPPDAYFQSAFRHFMDWWFHHDGFGDVAREGLEEALCALIFNVQGYLDAVIRGKLNHAQNHGTDDSRLSRGVDSCGCPTLPE